MGLTLTIAKYYTPSGVSIHKKGLDPDYIVSLKEILKDDKDNVNTIINKKLHEKFVESHKAYNKKNVNKFMKFLKENNLKISSETASYILKNEINRYSKRPIYDLEFDNQLLAAIEVIEKE